MVMGLSITAISLLFLIATVEAQAGIFDVTKYGAKPNSEISQAFLSAWKEACAATTPSKIVIPTGTYLLNEVIIEGPCKAPIEIQLQGTLKAPADPRQMQKDGWITIQRIDFLTISGSGTFDGQGPQAWKINDCSKNPKCKSLPMNLRFNFVTNSIVQDVTSLDSKNFHVNVLGCKNFTFQHFTITAPGDSLNTDGIHIGRSIGVKIIDTTIKTGDDCISIGDGSQQINIEKVNCGPGHGISVGSLGKYTNEEPVVGIFIKNCTLTGTTNGVRVKTWPASPKKGVASDMHFEDIVMDKVGNPVLIDQEYCPWNQCIKKVPSSIKISKVSFKNIRGTSSTQLAVKLLCSKSFPCEDVEVGDINLSYSGPEGPAITQCDNIKPKFTGKQIPETCTNTTKPVQAA